jgi:hypothetical protein
MRNQITILLLGEVEKQFRGEVFHPQKVRSAPHYFEISIPHPVIVDETKITIGGHEITFSVRGYPPEVILIQSTVEVPDIFNREEVSKIESEIYEKSFEIFAAHGGKKEYSEMYSIFSVSGYEGEPEQFLKHAPAIVSLLKSETIPLDEKEIEHTLSTQIKYAKNDLAIIDWDGAFLFDPKGEDGATTELLTLANLQLLRHRILDRKIDHRLDRVSKFIKQPTERRFWDVFHSTDITEDLRQVIKIIMSSISEMQLLERDIKLIGDWYSARIFEMATKKFKVQEWRVAIKEKLDLLQNVYAIVRGNFTISRKDSAEWIQIFAWFVLIILEFLWIMKAS